jgi:crotonobetainyl-CoA:carnitine CoA-transferase CaiB-like acyl-CoA transferase
VLTTGTTEHWVELLEPAGVPCGPVYNYGQMFADPQVKHREMIQYAEDAELGEVPHIRTPVRIGDAIKVRAVAPKLGEHNAEIYGRLGYSAADLVALKAKRVI